MKASTAGYFLVFLSLILSLQAQADTQGAAFTLRFSEDMLRTERQDVAGRDYDLVRMYDLGFTRDPGSPCMPVATRHVYVPRGRAVTGVRVESVDQVVLPGYYLLLPGQHEAPLSMTTVPDPVLPDPGIYAMTEQYPVSPVEIAALGSMGGRKVCGIRVYPVQYIPAEGKVLLNREINFTVEFGDAEDQVPVPAETPAVRTLRNQVVESMVENSDDLEFDFPLGSGTLDPAAATEYLILCHVNHADEYALLKDWKTRKGIPAAILTVQDVYETYPGRDDAEKLRNCIKDYYLNQSTVWVLMTLSAPKAAIRGCYCKVGGTVDPAIPCDLYFADMDGDWNDDNDGYWGETSDDVDLYPDVYVGRLPGNTGLQALATIEKVLTYEGCYTLPTDYQTEMLFLAEYADPETNGAVGKNLIDTESVPSGFDPITKLYESSGNLNHSSAMNALNSGMAIINHDGHGNANLLSIGPSVLDTDDMMALTNAPRYSIFYTVACIPGNFENVMGCFARGFLESENGGGFFVGNSRYGWYWPGNPGYGTGELYDREFFESMFVRGMTNLGIVHADAKIQRIPYSGSNNTDRWTQFTCNLFGDPETPVWKDTPLDLAASHPDSILVGNHMLGVTVTSEGSPVAGARVCLWMGDDLYLVDETGAGGTVQFEFSVVVDGDILVTATKNGYLPYLGAIGVGGDLSGVTADRVVRAPMVRVSPNPVSGGASIAYELPRSAAGQAEARVAVSIYDASGRLVRRLFDGNETYGENIAWDGRLEDGSPVPPGIYFARLASRRGAAVTKFVVLR
jgi:hypothetical protein